MKIIILTEGGKNFGLGHITRCLSLYFEASKRGFLTELIINGDLRNVEFLNETKYKNENWLQKSFLDSIINENDRVIIDSYIAEKDIYEYIFKRCKKTIFIDDFGRINYPESIIVNPSLDSSNVNYSNSQKKMLFSGPEFVIIRHSFVNVKNDFILNGLKRVLVTLGGTDIRKLIPIIIINICKILEDIKFDIVVGSIDNNESYNKFSKFANVNIYYNVDAAKMSELMISCDLAITAAGQTIYELLVTQTPFIPIQTIENQVNNIKSLLKYNPKQIVLKFDNSELVENILSSLAIYDSIEYRLAQIKQYEGLIDGYGAERVINLLLDDIKVKS